MIDVAALRLHSRNRFEWIDGLRWGFCPSCGCASIAEMKHNSTCGKERRRNETNRHLLWWFLDGLFLLTLYPTTLSSASAYLATMKGVSLYFPISKNRNVTCRQSSSGTREGPLSLSLVPGIKCTITVPESPLHCSPHFWLHRLQGWPFVSVKSGEDLKDLIIMTLHFLLST